MSFEYYMKETKIYPYYCGKHLKSRNKIHDFQTSQGGKSK